MHVQREAFDGIVEGLKFHDRRADGVQGRCIAPKSPLRRNMDAFVRYCTDRLLAVAQQ